VPSTLEVRHDFGLHEREDDEHGGEEFCALGGDDEPAEFGDSGRDRWNPRKSKKREQQDAETAGARPAEYECEADGSRHRGGPSELDWDRARLTPTPVGKLPEPPAKDARVTPSA
jgi:hypothetical protein